VSALIDVEVSELRQQLDRITRSELFWRGRMGALLGYLIEASVGQRGQRVDQRAIAMDVLGRGEDFDPSSDAIVRAEVRRLRTKLVEYYAGPGVDDPIRIELPRGQYAPMIRRADAGAALHEAAVPHAYHEIRYCRAADGVSIAYSVAGEGYPLFLLPHWMSHLDADLRNPLLRHYWLELTRRYTVIRFDLRDFGLSDRGVPDYTIDTLVSDLGAVAGALGLERFALFGPSGGALLGSAYAARYPERVSHLIFLDGFIRGARTVGDPDAFAHAEAMDAAIRAGWGKPDSVFRRIFTMMLVPNGTPQQHALLEHAQLAAGTAESAARFHALLCDTDLTSVAASIRAKTLVFHGSREAVPFREAQHAAAHIPNARLVPLPTENHILMANEPAWGLMLEELERFLPRHAPRSR
jgi:pimeloyl-ACP methyl ester carboxylesterase